jgi:lincosamide nucleotidyltransferase A/C/D/E
VQHAARGVDWCVVGGWGVDALLGRVSRPHRDLDVLLSRAEAPAALSLLAEDGFRFAHRWSESRDVAGHHPLVGEPMPSAFVLEHPDGREVDVHLFDADGDRVVVLWDTDRTLEASDLAATGSIGGVTVRCMTASMQLTCHLGYELPAAHAADVRLLHGLA